MEKLLIYMRKPAYFLHFYVTHPLVIVTQSFKHMKAKKISSSSLPSHSEKVSIIIVTYNALDYIKLCLKSLQKTHYKNKEVIVVDNNSSSKVKQYLRKAKKTGLLDKVYFSKENTYFSGGNNLGSKLADKNSKYLLFLNSDIEIKNPYWLNILVKYAPTNGVISFGGVNVPVIRPDGWCFMVNKRIFEDLGGLDEYFKMDWAITDFTGRLLKTGYAVKTIFNPNAYVYHFGQKSRPKKISTNFNHMTSSDVLNLFKNSTVELLKL
jgi:GT2 family glycosyltransferase